MGSYKTQLFGGEDQWVGCWELNWGSLTQCLPDVSNNHGSVENGMSPSLQTLGPFTLKASIAFQFYEYGEGTTRIEDDIEDNEIGILTFLAYLFHN